jgi:hypothetical protein
VIGGDQPEAQFHQDQADRRFDDAFTDRPDDQGGHDVGGAGRVRQDGDHPVGDQQRHGPERRDPPEVRPDQVYATAQPGHGVLALELNDRPGHRQQGDGDKPGNDQGHQPDQDDQGDQQVGQDQRAPGQRPQHVADPAALRLRPGLPVLRLPVLSLPVLANRDQPAQEAGQEHRAEQAHRRGGHGAGHRRGHVGPVQQMVGGQVHRHRHRGHDDRDNQDPPGMAPGGMDDGHGDRPESQRLAA